MSTTVAASTTTDSSVATKSADNLAPVLIDPDVNDQLEPLEDQELDALRDEIYGLIRNIHDPEHPYSIEELGVVYKSGVSVAKLSDTSPQQSQSSSNDSSITSSIPTHLPQESVSIEFKPTVPHCTLATLIGLCIRTKILQTIPKIKFEIHIKSGTHQTEQEINKQLNDKERATAALENPALRQTVEQLIQDRRGYE